MSTLIFIFLTKEIWGLGQQIYYLKSLVSQLSLKQKQTQINEQHNAW